MVASMVSEIAILYYWKPVLHRKSGTCLGHNFDWNFEKEKFSQIDHNFLRNVCKPSPWMIIPMKTSKKTVFVFSFASICWKWSSWMLKYNHH